MGFLFGGAGTNATGADQPTWEMYKRGLQNEIDTPVNQYSNESRGQQQNFINALQQAMMGQGGPSPAQIQQQQALQAAQQQAAGLAASQRGINPAMAARLASRSQADLAGQGIQQGSLLRAQEQLAARNQLGQALTGLRQQDLAGEANRTQRLGIYGGLANQLNALSTQAQNQNVASNQGILGGLIGGVAGAGAKAAGLSDGGVVGEYANGGSVEAMAAADRFINALSQRNAQASAAGSTTGKALGAGMFGAGLGGAKSIFGGKETNQVDGGLSGGLPGMQRPMVADSGGKVPGRAEVDGDSPKNDKVPAWLSPGEIVIPRSIADDPDAAKDFVAAISKRKSVKSYGEVISAKKKAMNCGGKA